MLYDFKTQKWSQLDDGFIGDNPAWSHDGKYLYYLKPNAPAMLRVFGPGGKLERVADSSVLVQRPGSFTTWSSLTPDNAFLLIHVDSRRNLRQQPEAAVRAFWRNNASADMICRPRFLRESPAKQA